MGDQALIRFILLPFPPDLLLMLPDPLLQALDLPSVSSLTQPIPLANLDLQALLLQMFASNAGPSAGPRPSKLSGSAPATAVLIAGILPLELLHPVRLKSWVEGEVTSTRSPTRSACPSAVKDVRLADLPQPAETHRRWGGLSYQLNTSPSSFSSMKVRRRAYSANNAL
jgi:hypothetical protein